jgi:hypothetical protein
MVRPAPEGIFATTLRRGKHPGNDPRGRKCDTGVCLGQAARNMAIFATLFARGLRAEPGLRQSRTADHPVARMCYSFRGQGSFGSPGLLRPGRGRVREWCVR